MFLRKSSICTNAVRAFVGLSVLCGTPGGTAQAATQGTLGATSTGSITITASVPNRAQITGLADVSFTNADPSGAATNTQSNCVWSNTATKGYSITATGSGTAGAFTLANGSLTAAYTVQWAASSGQATGSPLTAGTALSGLTSLAVSPTCASAPTTTSSLIIGMSAAALQGMQSSTVYTGTLTLLVTPQ
ncbi:hypothetical protein [Sphingobium sp.]|uniref:hypothetical protein n=1 Tax=Sphingobium sp. TaxID=1912891 RepID=UPI003B3B8819